MEACEAAIITTAAVTTPAPVACSKCATNNAGKRSCCALGGSWFRKCGDPGDSNFDHTWVEGMEACKAATSITTAINHVCPKCGTNKSGKRSCCVRHGAWFGNCGNEGDSKFDHTWTEGIDACETAASTKTMDATVMTAT